MWTTLIVMLAQATVQVCQDPNCWSCIVDDNGVETCTSCLNGLFPSGFQCIPCDHDLIQCEPCYNGLWTCKCYSPDSINHCGACPGDCSNCEENVRCQVRPLGSYIDSAGNLQDCAENCKSCTGENWCTECEDGLEAINGNCCVPGCKECSMKTCKTCEDGYEKVGDNCADNTAKCSEGCSKCLNENICFECTDGYHLEGDECVACDENCLVCDSFGCNMCSRGFGVQDGLCVPCTSEVCPVRCRESCEICNSDLSCVRCFGNDFDNEAPSDTVCRLPYCYENCAEFGSQLCLRCMEGYYLSVVYTNGEGCCKRHCKYPALETSVDGTAILCRDGYKIVNGCCEPICYFDNCLAVDTLGNCVKCPIGYILQNGCCVPYCCKKSAVHCISYYLGYCQKCEDGWALVNGCCHPKCPSALSQPSPYSIIVGNYVQDCFACRWPSVDTPSGCCRFKCCKKSEDNCLAISIFGHCALCKPGWIVNSYGCCVKKQCTVYPVGYFSHGEWCFKCPDGYFERDGCCFPRCCEKSRKACKTWNVNGFCLYCHTGYFVGPYGCCIPKCNNNLIISNWFIPGQGWCYKCPDGYTIIGYYQPSPTARWIYSECCKPKCCPKSSAQCAVYLPTGWCQTCKDGYVLSSRGCCIPKCNPEGLEEYIGSFWVLDSVLASEATDRVSAIVPFSKYICWRCKPGYTWNAATKCCVRKFHCCNPPKQDTTGAYVCPTGYFFDDTTYCCKPKCNNNCLIPFYSSTKGICYTCRPGCVSVAGTPCCIPVCCSSSEIYCASKDETGQCTSCSNGAELPSDFPCCPIMPNSPGHVHNIDFYPEYGHFCTRLSPGSQWITPLTCARRCCPESISHCYIFDKTGQCTGCKDGWVLDEVYQCCKPDNSFVFQYDPKDNDFCYVCPTGTVYNALAGCVPVCTRANAATCKCIGDACVSCEAGWTKVNGICVESCKKNHCLRYDSESNLCVAPETGYVISYSACPQPACNELEFNCKTRDSDGWCTACNPGFYLSAKDCCIPTCPNGGCLSYSDSGFCVKCEDGLLVNGASGCCEPVCAFDACARFANGWCVSCPFGYYLEKGCCKPLCDDSLLVTGTNNECIDGYRYNSTSTCCVPVCENEYLCAQRSADGVCTGCFTGNRFDVETSCCFPVCTNFKFCRRLRADGVCLECFTGYQIDYNGCCVPSS